MGNKLMVLAAGMSSRMKKPAEGEVNVTQQLIDQADRLPKGMIGVGESGRPFLDYILYNAHLAGYTEILLILNPADTVTKAHCDKLTAEGKVWGLSFCYATQLVPEGRTKPLGTADAVLQALEQNPDWQTARFMVCNSDNLYSVDVLQKVRECPHPNCFPNYNFDAMGFEFERYRMFGIVKTDEDGFLTALIEKPDEAQAQALKAANCGVSMNVFSFQGQDIMPYLQKVPLHPVRLEKELAGAVNLMAQENPKLIFTIPVSELVPDLTSKADISVVQAFLQATFGDF